MKEKTIEALRSLLTDVADHEAEDRGSAVNVDLEDLKRVLRWSQNNAHVWFKGDRVKLTGASVPFTWIDYNGEGTVIEESHEDGRARVEWDHMPVGTIPVWMFHNEIKRVK